MSGIPSIREYLEANPLGPRDIIHGLCEQHGIDLDSPWPPVFDQPKQAVLRALWPDRDRKSTRLNSSHT